MKKAAMASFIGLTAFLNAGCDSSTSELPLDSAVSPDIGFRDTSVDALPPAPADLGPPDQGGDAALPSIKDEVATSQMKNVVLELDPGIPPSCPPDAPYATNTTFTLDQDKLTLRMVERTMTIECKSETEQRNVEISDTDAAAILAAVGDIHLVTLPVLEECGTSSTFKALLTITTTSGWSKTYRSDRVPCVMGQAMVHADFALVYAMLTVFFPPLPAP